jgi:peptide/nickel transport system ATP-binding protein
METGTADQIARAPAHPYTYTLHDAAPVPDPSAQRARRRHATTDATGAPQPEVAAAGDPACPFAPRCPYRHELCWVERPELRPSHDSGTVACHRYPQWREDLPSTAEAASRDITPARERWARLPTTKIETGRTR